VGVIMAEDEKKDKAKYVGELIVLKLKELEKKVSIAEAYEVNKRIKDLEKKVDDVKAMTKHSHPVFKLKGNQNFDEIREIRKEISSLRDRVDELKVFRHHVAMPRIITIEEVLRKLFKKREEYHDSSIHQDFYIGLLSKLDAKDGEGDKD